MNEWVLKIINILHILFVLFILIAPFMSNTFILVLYAIIAPFMMFHWYINNNTCALTVLEKAVRKETTGESIPDEDCFTCRIIHPVYDFTNNYVEQAKVAYIVVTILWIIVLVKLFYKFKYGEDLCSIENRIYDILGYQK